MKRFVMMLCFLLLLIPAKAEEIVQYEARSSKEFRLFSAIEDGKAVIRVPDAKKVKVLEYGDEWCLVKYDGQTGYCKTKLIYHFRSLDPMQFPVPGMKQVPGYIRFLEDTFISGGKFEGVTALAGQVACVNRADEDGYVLPVWRGEAQLPASAGEFCAFADWRQAESGDVIGGFTTYFGKQQGNYRPEERKHNIELGCERIHEKVIDVNETFSFNKTCAPYSQNNGYQYAPNISKDGYGYGGGVCQVTTTLYNAVITLPLQVEKWEHHVYNGVVYVPQFFDAAVGSSSDFTFVNILPYPIRILAYPQDGVLTVLICRA